MCIRERTERCKVARKLVNWRTKFPFNGTPARAGEERLYTRYKGCVRDRMLMTKIKAAYQELSVSR